MACDVAFGSIILSALSDKSDQLKEKIMTSQHCAQAMLDVDVIVAIDTLQTMTNRLQSVHVHQQNIDPLLQRMRM